MAERNSISDDAEALKFLDQLSRKATGGIRFEVIENPAPIPGAPSKILIGVRDGERPEFISVKEQFSAYRTGPERRKGRGVVTTLESFVELVNRHKDDDSVIFARTAWPEPKLTAVIDYHRKDKDPRFGEHRIEYSFPLTDEFKTWINSNGKLVDQAAFAEFLEDHAAELAAPTPEEADHYKTLFKERVAQPIELIDLSKSLEVFVGAKIKQASRVMSGERTIVFEQTHMNAVGEPVDIPGIFMISLPAFVDGDAVRIPARLRYRAGTDGIKWTYQLYRWEYWLRTQVQLDLATAGDETKLPTFEGAPEA